MKRTFGFITGGNILEKEMEYAAEHNFDHIEIDLLNEDTQLESFDRKRIHDLKKLTFNNHISISLHLPYTGGNHHIIGSREMKSMKQGTIIINTSRGGLLDEEALYRELQSGHLGGAGLDVFEDEPYSGPLCDIENVILTPHIASSAGESRLRMEEEAVNNLVMGLDQSSTTESK